MIKLYALSALLLPLFNISASAQCDTFNLALHRPAMSSSDQGNDTVTYNVENAFDGDTTGSRWSSQFGVDPQWIIVDLGAPFPLCSVKLFWESAYATAFNIDGSNDTTGAWTTLQSITGNTSTTNLLSLSGSWRFVRLYGISRALSPYGYSLYDMQIFGIPTSCASNTDLAFNQPASATSQQNSGFAPSYAVDNDPVTRWNSLAGAADPQQIAVDLGANYPLCQVVLHWFEDTWPTNFSVDLSTDSVTWTTDTTIAMNTYPTNVLNINGSGRYVRLTLNGSHDPGLGYALADFAVTANGAALPVQLTTFTGTLQSNETVLLKWTTQMETNNKLFNLQRSTDAINYASIGQVTGSGNSSLPIHYTFTDNTPFVGPNYYRLQQVDLDGKSSYSPIVSVVVPVTNSNLSIYPNPVIGQVHLVNPDGTIIKTISIYNATGSEVKQILPQSGDKIITIPVSELSNGLYTIKVVTDKGATMLKMIK